MSDLISRQAAIDIVKSRKTAEQCEKGVVRNWAVDLCVDALEKLPSVQPEQRWIPCSERLPEEGEVVLTQAKFKDDVKMAVSSRIDYTYWTTWGTRDINIVAWMPLPEPYQEGEQE